MYNLKLSFLHFIFVKGKQIKDFTCYNIHIYIQNQQFYFHPKTSPARLHLKIKANEQCIIF